MYCYKIDSRLSSSINQDKVTNLFLISGAEKINVVVVIVVLLGRCSRCGLAARAEGAYTLRPRLALSRRVRRDVVVPAEGVGQTGGRRLAYLLEYLNISLRRSVSERDIVTLTNLSNLYGQGRIRHIFRNI